jgi:serine protease Do
VVQIATSKNVRPGARDRRGMPGLDDPFFRRFFGLPDQDEDNQPQQEEQRQPRRRGGKENLRKEAYGLGSGVIVSSEGHILTNNHVIEGADDIIVTLAGDKKEYKAKKVGTDAPTDLAVLKLEGKEGAVPAITFADSDKLKVGDFAIAVGNPFGLTQTVTMGIISATGRHVGILETETDPDTRISSKQTRALIRVTAVEHSSISKGGLIGSTPPSSPAPGPISASASRCRQTSRGPSWMAS